MNSQVFSKTHARKMQKLKTKNRAKNLKEIKNDSKTEFINKKDATVPCLLNVNN